MHMLSNISYDGGMGTYYLRQLACFRSTENQRVRKIDIYSELWCAKFYFRAHDLH